MESGALVLIGDNVAFERLVAVLRASEEATIDVDALADRSAIAPIHALHLERADGVTTNEVSHDAATLSGNADGWALLADEIEFFLGHNDLSELGMHIHIRVNRQS